MDRVSTETDSYKIPYDRTDFRPPSKYPYFMSSMLFLVAKRFEKCNLNDLEAGRFYVYT